MLVCAWIGASFLAQGLLRAQSIASTPQQLARQLDQRVSITWQGQQLGDALQRLADAQRIALWVDRRVDPGISVNLAVEGRPLREALDQVAEPHGYAAGPFQDVLYFGPKQTASELATLATRAKDSLSKAPPAVRWRWLKAEPWSFARLSEPRALVRDLIQSTGAISQDDKLVPHDLWPARTLPPLSAVDRMVLLLAGFDLTCQVSNDGRQVRIVPIKRPVHVTRAYSIRRDRLPAVESILAAMPDVVKRGEGGRLVLSARVEEHDRIASAIRGQAPSNRERSSASPSSSVSERRFTLKIENQPVGAVVDQLARQLTLEVTWDAALKADPKRGREALASCDVQQADLDGLLKAVLASAKLDFEREGAKVISRPGIE